MNQMTMLEQFIRIVGYSLGSYLLGDGIANSAEYQAALGGAVAIASFGWFLYRQRRA